MRKILFVLFITISFCNRGFAIDRTANILSLLNLSSETVTRDKVTSMLGKPASVEENSKRIWWHYTNDNTRLDICWNKKSDLFENFSFKNEIATKTVCNGQLCSKLQSGSTNIVQAIKLLGTPSDMKIKGATQELHYSYQNVVMRLFFRNRVLVDFSLLTQLNK